MTAWHLEEHPDLEEQRRTNVSTEDFRGASAVRSPDVREDEMGESLGEALPNEMARVRDVVMPQYLKLGRSGMIAVLIMRNDLDAATKALAEGDVVAMIKVYGALKEWRL